MPMNLRPYQQEAVDAVYEHLRTKDTNPCEGMCVYFCKCAFTFASLISAEAGKFTWGSTIRQLLPRGKTAALHPRGISGYFAGNCGTYPSLRLFPAQPRWGR